MARRTVRRRVLSGVQAGKYARWELERRFLVTGLPEWLDDGEAWAVTDRYLEGTHLRLRGMEPMFDGAAPIWKIGKKEAPHAPDTTRTTITTIYLTAAEHAALAALPAHELRKTRYRLAEDDRPIAVDVFEGALRGLVLAEVCYETEEELTAAHELPGWLARDVSDDPRLTGAALAVLDAPAAARLIGSL
jgi:CYTH domain-containing protein